MADDPLEPTPPVGVTRGLIRHRDTDYEFEDPTTGVRHATPIAQDIIWVVIRARGEEICRLRIPTAELLGDTPYVPFGSTTA